MLWASVRRCIKSEMKDFYIYKVSEYFDNEV